MNDEFKELLKSLIGVKSDKGLQQYLNLLESKKNGTVEALYQYYTEIKNNPQMAQKGLATMAEVVSTLLGDASPRTKNLNQTMTNSALYAELGAKLNYLKQLRGECPEGYEKFAQGGKCKKCKSAEKEESAVTSFKKGCRVKKRIKKSEYGNQLIKDVDDGSYFEKKKRYTEGPNKGRTVTVEGDYDTGTNVYIGTKGEKGVSGEFGTRKENAIADSLDKADGWNLMPNTSRLRKILNNR